MKCSFGISNFIEEISSLSYPVVFLYFFALIAEEGFLISPCYSLELCIQMLIFPFLLCFSLLFFSQLFVMPSQTAILLFCISFPCGCSWSLSPVQCHEPPFIVHQALYLSDLDMCEVKWSEVAQLCLILCYPMDCSLPGSSLHGILLARVLEWVAISFSRGASRPRDRTQVSRIPGRCLNLWATREAQIYVTYIYQIYICEVSKVTQSCPTLRPHRL